MRLYTPTLGARSPQNPLKVPFKELYRLTLKDKVDNKKTVMNEGGCLHELSMLLACLEKNSFNDMSCPKEIKTFQSCFDNYIVKIRQFKEQQAKGIMVPGSKNLTPLQKNILLKRFPNPK